MSQLGVIHFFTLWIVFLFRVDEAAKHMPQPPNITCEWHLTKEFNKLYIFFDGLQEDTPLHISTAVCSSSTLIANDSHTQSIVHRNCSLPKSVMMQRVFSVASFLLDPMPNDGKSQIARARVVSHPEAKYVAHKSCRRMHQIYRVASLRFDHCMTNNGAVEPIFAYPRNEITWKHRKRHRGFQLCSVFVAHRKRRGIFIRFTRAFGTRRSAVLSLNLVNNLCEPTHALLEVGAMLRISNGRLFWVWSGRDPSRLSAAPRVSKSDSQYGSFEMRLPALCSYVRPRQTHMKGQPFMHKFAYRSLPPTTTESDHSIDESLNTFRRFTRFVPPCQASRNRCGGGAL